MTHVYAVVIIIIIFYFSCYHDSPDPSLGNIIIRTVALIHKLRAEGFMIIAVV